MTEENWEDKLAQKYNLFHANDEFRPWWWTNGLDEIALPYFIGRSDTDEFYDWGKQKWCTWRKLKKMYGPKKTIVKKAPRMSVRTRRRTRRLIETKNL